MPLLGSAVAPQIERSTEVARDVNEVMGVKIASIRLRLVDCETDVRHSLAVQDLADVGDAAGYVTLSL